MRLQGRPSKSARRKSESKQGPDGASAKFRKKQCHVGVLKQSSPHVAADQVTKQGQLSVKEMFNPRYDRDRQRLRPSPI